MTPLDLISNRCCRGFNAVITILQLGRSDRNFMQCYAFVTLCVLICVFLCSRCTLLFIYSCAAAAAYIGTALSGINATFGYKSAINIYFGICKFFFCSIIFLARCILHRCKLTGTCIRIICPLITIINIQVSAACNINFGILCYIHLSTRQKCDILINSHTAAVYIQSHVICNRQYIIGRVNLASHKCKRKRIKLCFTCNRKNKPVSLLVIILCYASGYASKHPVTANKFNAGVVCGR